MGGKRIDEQVRWALIAAAKSTLLVGVAIISSMACGGTVSAPPGGDSGMLDGCLPARGSDSGTLDACRPIPKEPVYLCACRARQADDCAPYKFDPASGSASGYPGRQGDSASATGYPQRCSVDIPRPDYFRLGCGPLRCYCGMYPGLDGSLKPTWICPS